MKHLTWGGCDVTSLAGQYGTPLYVMDESMIRSRCRALLSAVRGRHANICYAGKAFLTVAMARLINEEGLYLDNVSEGELAISIAAKFPPARLDLQGNAKTESYLTAGLNAGVGTIVVDSEDELDLLIALAEKAGRRQKILIRVSPGIDAHTLHQIQTAQTDCKFGIPVAHLERAVTRAMKAPSVDLAGLHVHVGSQLHDNEAHLKAVDRMTEILKELRDSCGFEAQELDLGGGFGIPFLPGEPSVDAPAAIGEILDRVDARCAELGIRRPEIDFEPGRWVIGEAGITLYTVQNVKDIPGIRTYVAVDGGMTDNPRPQLYGATYAVWLASDLDRPVDRRAAIAGPCCESGDLLTENTPVPELHRGDILAVPLTGAYTYSMFSTYNCALRPAVVFVSDGKARLTVRRWTLDDILAGQI